MNETDGVDDGAEAATRQHDVYFDTAGSQASASVLTTAGVVVQFYSSLQLEEQWAAVASEFGVKGLHMVDYAHFKNEFAGWKSSPERRSAFLAKIVEVAASTIDQVLVCGLDVAGFKAADSRYVLSESIGGAYSFCQISAQNFALEWIDLERPSWSQTNVFVEKGDVGQAAMIGFLERHKMFTPILLSPRDLERGGWAAVQLADFVAYECRKLLESHVAGALKPRDQWRKSLLAILEGLPVKIELLKEEHIVNWCEKFRIPRRPSCICT